MTASTDTIKNSYPLPVYNYRVEVAGESISFSEVSGLSLSYETTTNKESQTESGLPDSKILYRLSQSQPINITLKKGVIRGVVNRNVLYKWINTVQLGQIEKKDIYIRLCDETGAPVISWQVINAFPTKLDALTFDTNSNDVAIESMELMADRVVLEEA